MAAKHVLTFGALIVSLIVLISTGQSSRVACLSYEDKLWLILDDASLSVEVIGELLHDVKDKDSVMLNGASITEVLSMENVSLASCQADELLKISEIRNRLTEAKYFGSEADKSGQFSRVKLRLNAGAAKWADAQFNNLVDLCLKNIDQVVETAVSKLSVKEKNDVGNFVSAFATNDPSGDEVKSVLKKYLQVYSKSEQTQIKSDLEASCKRVIDLLSFRGSYGYNVFVMGEREVLKGNYKMFKVCEIYVDELSPGAKELKKSASKRRKRPGKSN